MPVPSLFKDTVYYESVHCKDPWHLHVNAATIMSFIVGKWTCLFAWTPFLCVSIYQMVNALIEDTLIFNNWILSCWLMLAIAVLTCVLFCCLTNVWYRFGVFDLLNHPLSGGKERPFKWNEEVALITGGARGIGWLLANELSRRGVTVIIWDIAQPPAEEIRAADNMHFMNIDIADSQIVKIALEKLQSKYFISILVNNAGICRPRSLVSLDDTAVQQTFAVNTLSHFWITRPILKEMIRRRYGHIVTVSSTMGLTGVADLTDYCASKSAVIGFHDALRQEINRLPFKHLIHSTMLCPGLILTGMFDGIKIKVPFLSPPLSPNRVVDTILKSLEDAVKLPSKHRHLDLESRIDLKRWSFADVLRQHKVIWLPNTYYLPPLLNIIAPVCVYDYIKNCLGGNSAITPNFKGRQDSASTIVVDDTTMIKESSPSRSRRTRRSSERKRMK